MSQEILEYKLRGYCCSQIVMAMGLERLGKENKELVEAMGGLCFGMNQGRTCGIITAAMCLLQLADPVETEKRHAADFINWFEDVFGSAECRELLEGNPLNKAEKCPQMLDAAFKQISELLEWD